MGMDIYGISQELKALEPKEPTTEFNYNAPEWSLYFEEKSKFHSNTPGAYFRSNIWCWRPIVTFLEEYADDILDENDIQGISQNSGHRIVSGKYVALRDRFNLAFQEGYVKSWIDQYNNAIADLPDESCHCCDGLGIITDKPLFVDAEDWDGSADCHVCKGSGRVQAWARNYPAYYELFEEFNDFLTHCGGFEVW